MNNKSMKQFTHTNEEDENYENYNEGQGFESPVHVSFTNWNESIAFDYIYGRNCFFRAGAQHKELFNPWMYRI